MISPQKNYIESTFERNCGATTPLIKVVSIRKADQVLDMENYQNWVFTAHGESTIETSWTGDDNILISFSTSDQSPTKKNALNDIKIIFSENRQPK